MSADSHTIKETKLIWDFIYKCNVWMQKVVFLLYSAFCQSICIGWNSEITQTEVHTKERGQDGGYLRLCYRKAG